jgi:hypothetical protein
MYSVTAEVFSLNNFLVSLVLLAAVLFSRARTLPRASLGAFLCGLALTNQHTSVLYVVILVPWVLSLPALRTPRALLVRVVRVASLLSCCFPMAGINWPRVSDGTKHFTPIRCTIPISDKSATFE